MSKEIGDEKEMSSCSSKESPSTCCQPADRNMSSCCSPKDRSWSKGKTLVSCLIIITAIVVGTNSFVRGTSAQSEKMGPAKSFSATLAEKPAVATLNTDKDNPLSKLTDIAAHQILDSLTALDTVAADKDVVFIVLPDKGQNSPQPVLKPVIVVVNNLWNAGQKVGLFTLKGDAADHDHLVRHFDLKTFPCVVILGREGSASAVSGDITEARLFNAFMLASKPASCCPPQGSASCCPK